MASAMAHLLDQPHENELRAAEQLVARHAAAVFDLRQQVLGPLDGPGHQLREVRDVDAEGDQVAGRGMVPLVDADRVGHGLEGVEADADRQDDLQKGQVGLEAKLGQQRPGTVDEEVEVLERPEQPQVDAHADQQKQLACPRALGLTEPPADDVVDDGRGGQQAEEPPVPPAVEEVAGHQQQDILLPLPQAIIERQHDSQKDREYKRIEQHGRLNPRPGRGDLTDRWSRSCD